MSADKDRGIRRQKQKRAKQRKKLAREPQNVGVPATGPADGVASSSAKAALD